MFHRSALRGRLIKPSLTSGNLRCYLSQAMFLKRVVRAIGGFQMLDGGVENRVSATNVDTGATYDACRKARLPQIVIGCAEKEVILDDLVKTNNVASRRPHSQWFPPPP